nr:BEACH domain-containing protein B isoform X1 [Ipomoea trifida]
MNIVKGVADLLRRSSSSYGSDSRSGSSFERFSPPTPLIRFSESGDEAILSALWARYENVSDKMEKKRSFQIFLKQFLVVFRNWEPINLAQSREAVSVASTTEGSKLVTDVVLGCSFGHPAEIILCLIEELEQITILINEYQLGALSTITSEGLPVLDALTVVIRSLHNCRLFGYYGGIQKLTALMKATVVQLKTIASALSTDGSLSNSVVERISIFQNILVRAVSIIGSFIDLQPSTCKKAHLSSSHLEFFVSRSSRETTEPSLDMNDSLPEVMLQWHKKAVVSVMEAGGLNWLVELLRVMRRLNMKEQHTDILLQNLVLETLQSALSDNPRGQNHFRSIGGLEVLLDGLGVVSNSALLLEDFSSSGTTRNNNFLLDIFHLHVLLLEVLREAVFGNLNNMQFLSENGRVHKFANSFCSLAFTLQKVRLDGNDLPQDVYDNSDDTSSTEAKGTKDSATVSVKLSYLQSWNDYVAKMSTALFSFLLPSEVSKPHKAQASTGRSNLLMSPAYVELSVKWVIRVLLIVFPCIKACSNQKELPNHLRFFTYMLQRCVLSAFKTILIFSPSLVDVFRAEGAWDFLFSENFFYFDPASGEFSGHDGSNYEIPLFSNEQKYASNCTGSSINLNEVEAIQREVISFMEFVATSSGSSHNLPECSVLLDALEQSACNPGIANVLARSLLQILQLSSEKSVSSFKTLDAIPRVLKIACVQAQESKRAESESPHVDSIQIEMATSFDQEMLSSAKAVQCWKTSMATCVEIFTRYFSLIDDAKRLILHSSACVDRLFDLFWEEGLRGHILSYILDLMKIISISEEDHKAKLYLCSKYLETFTHVKEHENFVELSIDLLVGMRDLLSTDEEYYQALFCDGECFIHVVSLLNGNLDVTNGEMLVLNVLKTLTCLLSQNDASKAAFRSLVGVGYQTLRSILLDFCQWQPGEALLNALLDMLVDGKFNLKANPVIKNEDVILLYLSVLQKSSGLLQQHGLNAFLQILRDSISNRTSCVRAEMLNFLLDWFALEDDDGVVVKIALLVQVIGGHSISGKDIRKIFALLRSEKVGSNQQYCSLLLTSVQSMLNEKGPTAFFDLNGVDSGISIKTPVHYPLSKGLSFTCWLRIESFPRSGTMGLFSFLTESGRGCIAVLTKNSLIYESINQKRHCVSLHVNLARKKWHFLCITHTIGRAFSGGSQLKCYLDGVLVSSEKCRYAKINEPLTCCTIGTNINFPYFEDNSLLSINDSSSFFGQIGPVYLFNDSITSEQVKLIYSLGPSYMYSFLDSEFAVGLESPYNNGSIDVKDGLASKIIFGLNAQASKGRMLFNVSPILDTGVDKSSFEATVSAVGTQLCSRRLLQQIIYCVGGVSVFFPLFTQIELYQDEDKKHVGETLLTPVTKERLTAEVIELIASVLDENLANQQQMLLLSGFSILGFLLQSVPPQQLNLETLSALKHLLNTVSNSGLSDMLMKDAISNIFLNPLIWVHSVYRVQRELYMFLIQQFDNDPRLLKSLCRLPRVLDIIQQFYCDDAKNSSAIGNKPVLHAVTRSVISERPTKDEIHKIRLLLLSLGEMGLREHISVSDINGLIAFFESSQDMSCIEDVLHMIIRSVSQKPLLASFMEQVNLIGGCHIFVNLLQRDFEPIRLLSLQFLGRLLVGLPSEKKGSKFFSIAVGRPKYLLDSHKKASSRMQPIFSVMSDQLFKFPQTDLLCATLFDVLLGGASPKQVLQKHNQLDHQKRSNSQFFLPQILPLIFRFLANCDDATARIKIVSDLLDLLDSNPSNIEALMEHGWNAWLDASLKTDALKNYKLKTHIHSDYEISEQNFIRSLYCVVLCHSVHLVKGGWQHLEETVNFVLVQCEKGCLSYQYFLRDLYEDLIRKLVDLSSEENTLVTQPCRDNMLYLLKLVDEMLLSEINYKLPFPASRTNFSTEFLEPEKLKDLDSALLEALQGEFDEKLSRSIEVQNLPNTKEEEKINEEWWNLYDNIWNIISAMNGKGSNKMLPKSSPAAITTFGQRARGLVESLNIPAAEMAAVVVSGGIGNALAGKPNKPVDKAMLLRGEKCPKIVFRLMILYLCKSSLERASRCVQQVIPLLPCLLTADDEQSKSRLQLFIWALLAVRSHYGMLDDGARFHVIAHLIRETVSCGKSMLATSIVGREDSADSSSNPKEGSSIHNLIQKDRVLSAFSDEVKYIKSSGADRTRQLQELHLRLDESMVVDSNQKKIIKDEIQSSLIAVLASDNKRRDSFQLSKDEEQQVVAGKWIHTFRSLIDERGPWSANPFPNNIITHWKLDKIEDAWRRRQKLRRNYHFDEKLCLPLSTIAPTDTLSIANDGKSGFGANIPEQMKRVLLKGIRKITDEGSSELSESDAESSGPVSDDPTDKRFSDVVKEIGDQTDIAQDRKDCSSSSAETENSEVLLSVRCVLVTPKRKLAGHLAVMKKFLHFSGEFLVEGTGGSSVFKNFDSSGMFDLSKPDQVGGSQKQNIFKWPISLDLDSERGRAIDSISALCGNAPQKNPNNIKRHRRWIISKVKAVHWTRYLLRYTAIEIFFNDSTAPVFLNFATQKDAKDVGSLIVTTRNESVFPKGYRDKTSIVSFVDRRVALEMAEIARESWRRREITNFEYLMILNTLAGRSYNDLTQYPVFPWVLADYSSETLDLNTASSYRDLSKPVGALDPKRLEVFEDRYRNFCDPDIPSFYYGSHYSSMGIVLFYLLRLEPFTALHRNLQGGKFDHADRLFQGVEGTFRNCLTNTSDVKELIPEFFYMPEFLINSNAYHFGVKQDGEPLGDVVLPKWAKGSPEEFISKHREALESEYVSSNLHHWIDLIFGYKQRGKPAVEAANVFYYLTYEGAVDLETMDDELQSSAIEDQIANFGQTPIQIFQKKHPRRGPPIPIAHPLQYAPDSITLTSIVASTTNLPSTVLYVNVFDSSVVHVNQGLTMSVKMWLTTQLQSGGNFTFSGSQDPFFGIGSDILSSRKIGSPLAENIELGAQCFATLPTPSENFLISCGTWENSFQVISLTDGRIVQSIRQHKDVVSCISVTSDRSIVATGSHDTTVMVWEIIRGKKRVKHAQQEAHVIAETPFRILCGHDDIITCLYASVELDVVISGSKDGTCVFHTLHDGRYIRSIRHPTGSPLSKLAASRHGRIVLYSDDDLSLHLYSINGKHIASSDSNGRLNCLELSCCGEFMVCAGDQGQIVVRSMSSLEIVKKYSGIAKVITSLTITPEDCFLAGTKDGNLLVYSIENLQIRKTSGQLKARASVS